MGAKEAKQTIQNKLENTLEIYDMREQLAESRENLKQAAHANACNPNYHQCFITFTHIFHIRAPRTFVCYLHMRACM